MNQNTLHIPPAARPSRTRTSVWLLSPLLLAACMEDNSSSDTGARPAGESVLDGGPGSLNDTGMSLCASDSAFFADCSAATLGLWSGLVQDALRGRDHLAAQSLLTKTGAGPAGFDYTKISAAGKPLAADAASWGCVLDNHTGLMWEVKRGDGGLRDWRHRYTWYNPDAARNGGQAGYQDVHEVNVDIASGLTCGNSLPQCNTQAFVTKVNETGICGYKDWVLPDQEQLLSLPHYGRLQPAIDTDYFPRTAYDCIGLACGQYWSASTLAASSGSEAWFVFFTNGYDNHSYKSGTYHVRLVRRHVAPAALAAAAD